jgi:hypothetical protein
MSCGLNLSGLLLLVCFQALYNSRRRTALFNSLGGGSSFRSLTLLPCDSGAYHLWDGLLGSLHDVLVGLLFSFIFLGFPSSQGPFRGSVRAACFRGSAIRIPSGLGAQTDMIFLRF